MKLNMILTLVTLTLTSGCALAPISEVCADATNYNQCYSDETAHRKAMDDWNDRIVAAQQKAMADYAKNHSIVLQIAMVEVLFIQLVINSVLISSHCKVLIHDSSF